MKLTHTPYVRNCVLVSPGNPYFKTTDKPRLEDITSSSVVVSWSKATDVTPGLESHYYYVVWLGLRGGTTRCNRPKHVEITTYRTFI